MSEEQTQWTDGSNILEYKQAPTQPAITMHGRDLKGFSEWSAGDIDNVLITLSPCKSSELRQVFSSDEIFLNRAFFVH